MRLTRALLLLALLLPSPATAGFERSLFHYVHQRWSAESDAPSPVVALAQDRTGYLWVAAGNGLFRFDGIRFERIGSSVDLAVHGAPSALLVRRNGEVWTSFERSRRFAVYRDGRLQFLRAPPAPARIMAMHETRDRTVWALTERIGVPLLRFRDGRWTSFGTAAGAPLDNPFSMVVTHDGVVWVSFTGAVARLPPDGDRFEFVWRGPGWTSGRLSIDPEERIWLTERRGSYPLTGPGGRGSPPPLRHAYATDAAQVRGWPTFDRDGNLWIATYYDGVQRVTRPDPRGAATAAEAVSRVERFTAQDGLSSNATTRSLQDAEGNVWVATENGLDRFWPASLRFEPGLTDPPAFGDLLLQASDGSVYIGQATTVYRVAPGGRPQPIYTTPIEPRTLCEAPDGSIWIGLNDEHVAIWRNGTVRSLGPRAPMEYTVYDCAFDARGDYWVTASLGGMARFSAGRWQRMFGPTGDAFVPKSMVADEHGRLIIHWNDRTLARLDGPGRTTTALPFGNHPQEDVALFPTAPGTLYVAGRFGLAQLRGDKLRSIPARAAPLLGDVKGMVLTPAGDLWLAAPGGLLRTTAAEMERALASPDRSPALQAFGAADGLRSRPHSHSRRAVVRGGDGRLWLATQTGILWLDPADLARSRTPPAVAVNALVADKVYHDPAAISLPAGTSNIEIDFAVLSFSNPGAARVRYRMDGQDGQWIEAGTRRQAFYTNLAPGSYRFHLIAANSNGVWNTEGTTLEFVIPPTFVQSRWFAALCALAALGLLWLAYRLRVAQVARRIRARLEERLGERERIARELHDTLLQSVQGLVLRFQSVANKMPAEGAARAQLEAALGRADEIIAEGRDRVQDLRVAEGSRDLPALLRERALGASFDPAIPIRIVVEGRPRPVHPLVSVELGRIAGEALFNAARHARASTIEITVRFTAGQLAVEIRDDGVGLPADIAASGHKQGHFGLVGMRERAERIGGGLSIESQPGMGCAVTIALPGRLAFADHAARGTPVTRRIAALLRKRREPGHA